MAITADPARVFGRHVHEEWEVEIQPSSRYDTESELNPTSDAKTP
jgi:hypothetical protein